jgi:hypothetical protein
MCSPTHRLASLDLDRPVNVAWAGLSLRPAARWRPGAATTRGGEPSTTRLTSWTGGSYTGAVSFSNLTAANGPAAAAWACGHRPTRKRCSARISGRPPGGLAGAHEWRAGQHGGLAVRFAQRPRQPDRRVGRLCGGGRRSPRIRGDSPTPNWSARHQPGRLSSPVLRVQDGLRVLRFGEAWMWMFRRMGLGGPWSNDLAEVGQLQRCRNRFSLATSSARPT